MKEFLWFLGKVTLSAVIALAYINIVKKHGHKEIGVPRVISILYYGASSVFNLYIAYKLFSNTVFDTNYNSSVNDDCTIGLNSKHKMGSSIINSKIEEIIFWFCASKVLRMLDSFILLSRETDKVTTFLSRNT